MVRYKPYERYKDSGVEWIGEIPEHWEVKPLFCYYKERKNKNIGGLEQNVLSLSYGRIKRRDLSDNFGLLPESFEGYNIVEPGNLVLRLTDLQNDHQSLRCGLVREIGVITSAYVTLESISSIDEDYGYWLMYAYDLLKVFYGFGAGVRQSMTFRDLKWIPLTLPSIYEQQAIADFLDQKTSELDGLIADKEKLVTLLQEYRQAIISEAVTKGLNPDVKMKDSGVDWIGKIPEHWDVYRVKHKFRIINGATPNSSESDNWDGDILWVTPVDLNQNDNIVMSDSIRKITRQGYQSCGTTMIPPGSIILSTRAPIGYVMEAGRGMCTNQGCKSLVKRDDFSTRFFYYHIYSAKTEMQSLGRGTTFLELGNQSLGDLVICFPPANEQQAIANYLDQKTSETDDLISGIQGSIAQLKSYRQSLISEAVTGKIDVRGVI